jgi:hypothetical protein
VEDAGEKETFCTVEGVQIRTSIMESNTRLHKKLNIELRYNPAITVLLIYLKQYLYTHVNFNTSYNKQSYGISLGAHQLRN